jgi:ATP-dependent helicase/nuclease subunit A
MRVLYVALTRAVDKLILIGTVKSIESSSKKWIRGHETSNLIQGQSYLDWLMSILSDHPVSIPLWQLNDKTFYGSAHDTRWSLEIVKKADLVTSRTLQTLTTLDDVENEEISRLIEERLAWTYEHQLSTELPSKLSVSDLKKKSSLWETKYNIEGLRRPKFLIEETELTGAEVGTLMHKVLQSIDPYSDDYHQAFQVVVEKGIISEDQVVYIDIERIEKFFNSPLGTRLRASQHLENEKAFVLSKSIEGSEDILVQGIIDCYFIEDGQVVLLDYKTDKVSNGKELIKRYHSQLSLYKEAIESITGLNVKESYIYSLYLDEAFTL